MTSFYCGQCGKTGDISENCTCKGYYHDSENNCGTCLKIGCKNLWISVKEKLPKNGEKVLAYAIKDENLPCLDCNYFEAHHYDGRWTENVDSCDIHVTHWMPLPEPPEYKYEMD